MNLLAIHTKAAVLCIAAAVLFAATSHAQLLQNGGFEAATLAPWTGSGDIDARTGTENPRAGTKYATLAFQASGSQASSLSFSQQITLPTAGIVSLEFFAQRFDPTTGQDDVPLTFEARIDSTVLSTSLPPFAGDRVQTATWRRYRLTTPTALPAGAHTITFTFTRGDSTFGRAPVLALDAASVTLLKTIPIFEGFDIPEGQPLSGQSGATSTGWNSAWRHPNNSGASGNVVAGSLVRPPGTESFFPEPIGNRVFLSGLQSNSRVTPDNLSSRAPSISGRFLAEPNVGFNAGFSINFEFGGGFSNNQGMTLLFNQVVQTTTTGGNGRWSVSNGFVNLDTGNSFLDGVEAVVFDITFDVDGSKDLFRVWFDADPTTEPPSFSSQAVDFGFPTPRFTVSFGSSNNFAGSSLAFDELRVEGFQDLVIPAQLLNISTRLRVLPDDLALIGGFIVTGNEPKKVLLRAIGPSLTGAEVSGALANPTLELFGGSVSLGSNDDWKIVDGTNGSESQETAIRETGVPPANDAESALVRTLAPGSYTVVVRGANSTSGVGLVEAYDLERSSDSKLANISTRGFVDTGDNVMIGGFIVGGRGEGSARLLVRALGPSLTAAGVPSALQNPTLQVVNAAGTPVATNDNWKENEADVNASGLPPTEDAESALVVQLSPGAYTAVVRGNGGEKGVGLVEAYNIP